MSDSLQPHGQYSPWNSPGQNTGVGSLNTDVGSLSFLQGIFPTQGSIQGLLHCRGILYQLSYQSRAEMLVLFLNLGRHVLTMPLSPCFGGKCLSSSPAWALRSCVTLPS